MKLKDAPYEQLFYWKGRKWKQLLRLKEDPKGAFTITCYEYPQGDYIEMPAGRKVKPVVRNKNTHINS